MRIPPTSLFNENLIEHVEANEVRYLRHGLSQIHVTVADRSLDQLADYATKTVKRGWVDPEDILVLPRSASEGRSGGLALGKEGQGDQRHTVVHQRLGRTRRGNV